MTFIILDVATFAFIFLHHQVFSSIRIMTYVIVGTRSRSLNETHRELFQAIRCYLAAASLVVNKCFVYIFLIHLQNFKFAPQLHNIKIAMFNQVFEVSGMLPMSFIGYIECSIWYNVIFLYYIITLSLQLTCRNAPRRVQRKILSWCPQIFRAI